MKKIISNKNELISSKHLFLRMRLPKKILMVEPTYFNIEYAINPHMRDAYGDLNVIEKEKAQEQWANLRSVYEKLGFNVFVMKGVKDLPDMVFCANQSFPYLNISNENSLLLSNMQSDIRQKEVPFFADFFREQNYLVESIMKRDEKHFFESTGDALWFPGRRFILGGYGYRTNSEVYNTLSEKTDAPVIILKLVHPKFYHLDTCLSILDEKTALFCPEAFNTEGIELLQEIFSNLIEVPLNEADAPNFACNAHCPNQKHVILQKGSMKTQEALVQNGFIPIEVDTSEFIKAGGSVFCMKLMFF